MRTATGTPATSPLPFPPPLAADVAKHVRHEVTVGDSGAAVFRFERTSGAPLYLKTTAVGPVGTRRPLFDEAERLGWMHAVGLPVPAVLQYHDWRGREYLLLSGMPGRDSSVPRPADRHDAVVSALAAGLRLLHGIDISACPFRMSLDERIAAAEARVRAGLVSESDFDDVRQGRTAPDLLAELVTTRPPSEDRVFTHGDYCLPNVLLEEDASGGYRVSGFVDCGNAGVADRYQDLALCARSIAYNLGGEWVPVLFARYGVDRIDMAKTEFYQLLDEFF